MKHLLIVTDSLGDANHLYGVQLEDTYAYKLEMLLRPDVYSKTFIVTGNTIKMGSEQVRTWFDLLGDRRINIAIVQLGIVDGAVRVVPTLIYHVIPLSPKPIRERIYKFLKRYRPNLQKMGFKFHFTSMKSYRKWLTELTNRLVSKCDAVFVMSICPGRKEEYEHSPGLSESIASYNKIIREVTSSKPVHFIDLSFMEAEPDKYLSPELHMLKGGHDYIFNTIVDTLKQENII